MEESKFRTLENELPAQSAIANETKQIQSEQIAVAFQQTTDETSQTGSVNLMSLKETTSKIS